MAEYPYTESGSFRVRPHRPWRTFFLAMILLAGAVVGGWWLYETGREHGGYEQRMARATETRLRIQIDELRGRVADLADRRTLLERSQRIDRNALERVEALLESREQRIGQLDEELAFYRSLVSPSDFDPGINIERISVYPLGGRDYRYEVVLTRMNREDNYAGGDLKLTVSADEGDERVVLALDDLLAGDPEEADTRFRFKYFQALSGQIRLPEGVTPVSVHVQVEPDEGPVDSVDDNFSWAAVLSGGN